MATAIWKFFVAIIKVGLVIASIVAPIVAILDIRDPWPESGQARIEFETDYFFVPIGGSWRGDSRLAQSALLVPKSFSAPMFVSIRTSDSGVDVQSDHFRFWLVVVYIAAGWYVLLSFTLSRLLGRSRAEEQVVPPT